MDTQTQSTPSISSPSRPLATAGLAIVLYLALIDAAVETFLSGSPVRWWVVGAVAVYLAASVALWRYRQSTWQSIGWFARASTSFFLLLGLLVFTVWLPGGLADGVSLLGRSTSTLLLTVTAVAVAVSGMILVLAAYSYHAIKWAVGMLAVYGVIAFLWAVFTGTSYSYLLHGESLWFRLPSWLQGALIGAILIVPGALVYRIGQILRGSRPVKFGTWAFDEVVLLGASLVIAIAALTSSPAHSLLLATNLAPGVRIGPLVFAKGVSVDRPIGRADRFQAGTKAVYAFFDVAGLKPGDTISGTWYKGAGELTEQNIKVSQRTKAAGKSNGPLWFTLTFDNGALPGGYFLEIGINGRVALAGAFAVDTK
jgi:hypothetical protein